MHPLIFLGGAAAAWLLTACSKNKDAEAKPPANPSSETEGLPLSPDFSQDPLAKESYERLKKLGIKDSVLNQGCPTIKYFEDGKTQRIIENPGDKILFPCEVYEFALDHYETYPELAESIAGRPIPWTLDDRDPATGFDEAIRAKVKKAIEVLDQLLKEGGFQPGSEEYQVGMLTGLFYFSSFPNQTLFNISKQKAQEAKKEPDKSEEELDKLDKILQGQAEIDQGLKTMDQRMEKFKILELKNYHEKEGGLYLLGVGYPGELTAIQALREGKGDCTEVSKILFAVLKSAGFSPAFVLVNTTKSDSTSLRRLSVEQPGYSHVCLQVKIGNRTFLLDPGLYQMDPPHHVFTPLTLREYFASDLVNQGDNDPEKEMELVDKALRFYPNFDMAYANRGSLRTDRPDWKKAIEDFDRGIQANPSNAALYYLRGRTYQEHNELDKALADFNQAIAKDPNVAMFYFNRGLIYFQKRDLQKSTDDFISCAKLHPQKSSQAINRVFNDLYEMQMSHPEMQRLRRIVQEDTSLDPVKAQAQIMTVGVLWQAGHRGRALKRIKNMIEIVSARQTELKKENKVFSKETLGFLSNALNNLPPSMKRDPEFQEEVKKLSLPKTP